MKLKLFSVAIFALFLLLCCTHGLAVAAPVAAASSVAAAWHYANHLKQPLLFLAAMALTFGVLCGTHGVSVAVLIAVAQAIAAGQMLARNPYALGVTQTQIPQTASQVRTIAPKNIGEKFEETVMEAAKTKDVFSMFEGDATGSSGAIVQLTQELTGGKADTVNIPVIGLARGEGVRGDGVLRGNEDFVPETSFQVKLDEMVNGLSITQLAKALKTYRGSVDGLMARSMSDWLGWKRQTDAMMKLRSPADDYEAGVSDADSRNILRPGNKSRNLLLSSDTISTAFIDRLGPLAASVGVTPTRTKVNALGATINGHLLFGPDPLLFSLNGDSTYADAAAHAQERGMGNTQFAGGYVPWRNIGIFHHIIVDEASYGPLGTPFLPLARLGTTGSDSTVQLTGGSAITLYGSGVTQNTLSALDSRQSYWKPYAFFPGYDYLFTSFQDAHSDSTQYYAWLFDTADRGIAFIRYQGSSNTGVRIQANRWTANGADGETDGSGSGSLSYRYIGGVNGGGSTTGLDSTSADYNWKTTFNKGTTYLVPASKWGVPIGWASVLGRGSLLRAYGYEKLKRIKDSNDYGRNIGDGILSVYGQNTPVDALGRANGHLLLECAVDHPGFSFPPVTASDVAGV